MKQFESKTIGLDYLSPVEMEMVNGGSEVAVPFGQILKWLARFVGEAVGAWGISEIMDYLTSSGQDDWCYWAYGGELEPAICEG